MTPAGHGIQANEQNYLIPVEEVENDSLLDYKALRVQHVLQRIDSRGCHLNLLLLDACRSKPSSMTRGSRDIGRGLAKMDVRAGSVIAFACEPGETAADGTGRNGVFTSKLLQHLGVPGVDVDFMLGDVALAVEQATSGKTEAFSQPQPAGQAALLPTHAGGCPACCSGTRERRPCRGALRAGCMAEGPVSGGARDAAGCRPRNRLPARRAPPGGAVSAVFWA